MKRFQLVLGQDAMEEILRGHLAAHFPGATINGHLKTPENTKVIGGGKRVCIICDRARKRKYKLKMRAMI